MTLVLNDIEKNHRIQSKVNTIVHKYDLNYIKLLQ